MIARCLILFAVVVSCAANRSVFSLHEDVTNWRDSFSNARWPQPKTLLSIHVAMGAWNMTEMMLVSLAQADGDFDVILLDDHSTFDVERVATRWGIRVLSWGSRSDAPRGLTHSWNLAWKYALERGYANLIICNNDLLVPRQTVDLLAKTLDTDLWGALLPSTSKRGSFYPHHALNAQKHRGTRISSWTDQPMHFQDVADSLVFNMSGAMVRREKMLNGYMMAFRVRMMASNQWNAAKKELFDPSKINIGNEDELFRRMTSPCGVHLFAFVFHFKGYTLTAGNRNMLHQKLGGRSHADLF